MNEFLKRLDMVLDFIGADICSIDWSRQGSKLSPYGIDGIPKWTGLLVHVTHIPTVGPCTQTIGFLPRPEKSVQTVMTKIWMLQENPDAMSSMELRNPDKGQWGGAVRSSNNPDLIYALTGLPEIGDHLTGAEVMKAIGLLDSRVWEIITAPDTSHMRAAREHVGMTLNQFVLLRHTVHRIVQEAMELLNTVT